MKSKQYALTFFVFMAERSKQKCFGLSPFNNNRYIISDKGVRAVIALTPFVLDNEVKVKDLDFFVGLPRQTLYLTEKSKQLQALTSFIITINNDRRQVYAEREIETGRGET